jgi:hypothetical protein
MQCQSTNPKGNFPKISIVTSKPFGNVPVEHLFSVVSGIPLVRSVFQRCQRVAYLSLAEDSERLKGS